MSYLDDAALHALADKRVYFFRISEHEIWFRYVRTAQYAPDAWDDYEEVVELQHDGTGKYVRCKKMPMKEDWFYKLKDEMMLIALRAQNV
jgi:hypothetical protein